MRKLICSIRMSHPFQLSTFVIGPKACVSYSRLVMMQLKEFTFQLLGFDTKLPYFVWPDTNRISFPALNLSHYPNLQVFGNSTNYFAATCLAQRSVFIIPTNFFMILSPRVQKLSISFFMSKVIVGH